MTLTGGHKALKTERYKYECKKQCCLQYIETLLHEQLSILGFCAQFYQGTACSVMNQ